MGQRRRARQPAGRRRQGLAEIAQDQIVALRAGVGPGPVVPVEGEDLSVGEELAQVAVGAAAAEPDLEHRAGKLGDPARGLVEIGALGEQARDHVFETVHGPRL